MSVTWAWVGRATPSSAWVRGLVSGSSVRLAVDTDPGLGSPTFFGPIAPSSTGIVSIVADGLDPATQYYWALEVDSVLDTDWQGSLRTHPPLGEPATVRFWAGSCAGSGSSDWITDRVSNHPAFESVRTIGGWDFGIHMGDLHYRDIGSGTHVSPPFDAAKYRQAFHDVLTFNGTEGADARQGALYRSAPLVYFWDDHDYGPNDSDGSLPHKDQAALAYRQAVPHYPLPDPGGAIYQSFQIGRVLVACLDVRFHKSPSTMLGAAQKTWLHDLLESSTAGFLVLSMGSQWSRATGTHADSWAAYPTERQDLVDMFTELGWAHRMCVVQGDNHAVGIDDGANIPGGFPLFQFAPFDSNPSNPTSPNRFNTFISGNQRGQWGSLEIVDHGNLIEVTGTAYHESSVLFEYTFTADPTPPEPPDPTPPDPGPGEILPAGVVTPIVEWLSCDLASGRVIARLGDLQTDSIARRLGSSESSGMTLPVPSVGPRNWTLSQRARLAEQATEPRQTMLVAVVNEQPAWAGVVLDRFGGTGATLQLPCVTLEGYLLHRYVRDHTLAQTDEARIAAALFADAGTILGLGTGIGLEIDAPDTGTLRDRTYLETDNATVYDRLRELMEVRGGPEWTIEVLWGDDTRTWVRKVARVRKRIGIAAATPSAVFRTTAAGVFGSRGASAARYTYEERHAGGLGANVIQAFSSGEGEDQPRSDLAVDTAQLGAGVPIWEHRFQPASNIRNIDVLNDHAERDLERRRNGERTWHIEARWNVYPRLNVDWRIGDDIGWRLVGHRHPDGVTGQGRAIGWTLDPQAGTVRPILLDPSSDGGQQ